MAVLKNYGKLYIERHGWKPPSLTFCFKQGLSQNYIRLLRTSSNHVPKASKDGVPTTSPGAASEFYHSVGEEVFTLHPGGVFLVAACAPCLLFLFLFLHLVCLCPLSNIVSGGRLLLDASSPSSSSSLGWPSPVPLVSSCLQGYTCPKNQESLWC